MLKKFLLPLVFFSFLISSGTILAAWPKTNTDYKFLPPYCSARASGHASPAYKKWKQKLAPSFIHIHHYCAALHSLRLARQMYPKDKETQMHKTSMLNSVFGEIKYVETYAVSTFILFPHIYTTKAEGYLEAKQDAQAIAYFYKAINANKKFTKPYALLSDYYKKKGMTKPAREILEAGLKYSPKSKSLNKRLKKLSK